VKSGLIRGSAFGGSGLIRGVTSLERDNYVVFYYLMICTCEFWSDKRVAFGGSGLIRGVISLEGDNYVVFYYLRQ
jgi:hypothetical protein